MTEQKRTRKNDALSMARPLLSGIPFSTVYSHANTLFNTNNLDLDSTAIQKEVDFLKNTRLADIVFEKEEGSNFFIMRNQSNNDFIEISNGDSSHGLRGAGLRELVRAEQEKDASQLAFDVISKGLKNPEHSDGALSLRDVLSNDLYTNLTHPDGAGSPMDNDHVDLFIAFLMSKVNESIVKNQIDINLEPSEQVQDIIWKSIDIEQIYEVTASITDQLNQLKVQAEELCKRGAVTAGKEMNTLCEDLKREKSSFLKGEINANEYAKNSSALLENASNDKLKEHRGILKILLNVLKFITLGFVKEITPTKSIQKTNELKGSLHHLKDDAKPLEENRSENTVHCGPNRE